MFGFCCGVFFLFCFFFSFPQVLLFRKPYPYYIAVDLCFFPGNQRAWVPHQWRGVGGGGGKYFSFGPAETVLCIQKVFELNVSQKTTGLCQLHPHWKRCRFLTVNLKTINKTLSGFDNFEITMLNLKCKFFCVSGYSDNGQLLSEISFKTVQEVGANLYIMMFGFPTFKHLFGRKMIQIVYYYSTESRKNTTESCLGPKTRGRFFSETHVSLCIYWCR